MGRVQLNYGCAPRTENRQSLDKTGNAQAHAQAHTPLRRGGVIWLAGMMIWHESESPVWGMGWSRMQMQRATWPTFFTLLGK